MKKEAVKGAKGLTGKVVKGVPGDGTRVRLAPGDCQRPPVKLRACVDGGEDVVDAGVRRAQARGTYGLTRLDQPDRQNHGWYVRLKVGGEQVSKYFSDKRSGSKAKSKRDALAYRDVLFERMTPAQQAAAAKRRRPQPQSGVPGVTRTKTTARAWDGVGVREYWYWQAAWVDERGRRRSGKYSVKRYGDKEAMAMAIRRQREEEAVVAEKVKRGKRRRR